MRFSAPDEPLAQTLLLMWLAIFFSFWIGYWLYRLWRKKHPRPPQDKPTTYSQKLANRFSRRERDHSSKQKKRPTD